MAVSSVSSSSHLTLAALITLFVLYVRSLVRWRSRTCGRPLPPGPKGLPFFGNVLDLRKGRPWIGFNELRKKHGSLTFSFDWTANSDLKYRSQVLSCTSKLSVSPLLCSGALKRYSNIWTDVPRTHPTASRHRALHCEFCVTPSMLQALADPAYCSTGHEWALGFLPYGPAWRRQRRIFWQHFHPGAIEKYWPVQLSAVHTFLAKVASDPDRLDEHIQ